ncbi:hypothetical protein SKA34_09663 [Photobacterium sp. SKA34]|uniref:hypothetical protein n=1 Tax=Photobacterium sp. SKA34 TaxID=121723 RepID=UPI00006AF7EA|nr:hypothetical protein [Photobacterium sp. SKA34]EAR54977.1 hypothetical protein SKA34_09663 [Photobacterium sp. SKA34]
MFFKYEEDTAPELIVPSQQSTEPKRMLQFTVTATGVENNTLTFKAIKMHRLPLQKIEVRLLGLLRLKTTDITTRVTNIVSGGQAETIKSAVKGKNPPFK